MLHKPIDVDRLRVAVQEVVDYITSCEVAGEDWRPTLQDHPVRAEGEPVTGLENMAWTWATNNGEMVPRLRHPRGLALPLALIEPYGGRWEGLIQLPGHSRVIVVKGSDEQSGCRCTCHR